MTATASTPVYNGFQKTLINEMEKSKEAFEILNKAFPPSLPHPSWNCSVNVPIGKKIVDCFNDQIKKTTQILSLSTIKLSPQEESEVFSLLRFYGPSVDAELQNSFPFPAPISKLVAHLRGNDLIDEAQEIQEMPRPDIGDVNNPRLLSNEQIEKIDFLITKYFPSLWREEEPSKGLEDHLKFSALTANLESRRREIEMQEALSSLVKQLPKSL